MIFGGMIESIIEVTTTSHISSEYSCSDNFYRAEGVSYNNKFHSQRFSLLQSRFSLLQSRKR